MPAVFFSIHFQQDTFAVKLYNAQPEEQGAGYFLVCKTVYDQMQHFLLPERRTLGLNSGQTAPLHLGFGIQNPGNLAADQAADVYVIVVAPNNMGVTANGQPVHVSYNNPDISNSQHCISVTANRHEPWPALRNTKK